MKILCSGDLHLGRQSSRLPDGHDPRRACAIDTWHKMVDYAIAQRVDLVALSGDLVEHDNRFYEAVGPLEAGVRRLARAGITTYAVAGNHDYDVLPRLVDLVGSEQFRLLGQGGVWERATVERQGRPVLHIDGWSFGSRWVRDDPLLDYPANDHLDGVPVLGMLHADLDRRDSDYCPVALGDLQAKPVSLWLLGHIHAPRRHADPGAPCVLYPGSPQALDPGEPDTHGPWIAELHAGQPPLLQQIPLSSVRYETLSVDVTGLEDLAAAERAVVQALRQARDAAAALDHAGHLTCLACRLHISGRTHLRQELAARLAAGRDDLLLSDGHLTAHIEKVTIATRPRIDLAQLRQQQDPTGELARLLLLLDSDQPLPVAYQGLLQDTSRRLIDVHRSSPYRALGDDPPPNVADIRRHLSEQGWALLDRLLAERRSA